MYNKEGKRFGFLKVLLTTIGIILFLLTALAILYKFFKKHFKITFECGDYDFSDDDCFDDIDYEPECCVYEGCCCEDCADDIADAIEDSIIDDAE